MSRSRMDVRLGEITALEKQWFAEILRERVGKTVTEIQPGFVSALAKIEEGLPSQMALLDAHRFDVDRCTADEGSACLMPSGPSCFSITMDSSR